MKEIVDITKATADETRLRILALLFKEELCVCQILEIFDLAPSTISRHLFILRQAGLVETRKEGRWIYYRLVHRNASNEIKATYKWLKEALKYNDTIKADLRKLDKILKVDPQFICARQNKTVQSKEILKGI